STAYDDVLRCIGLQYDRVDDGIAHKGREGQPHGQRVDEVIQQRQACSAENSRVSCVDNSPRGNGRARVRAMTPSIFCSIRQLMAAAAPATAAIPNVP